MALDLWDTLYNAYGPRDRKKKFVPSSEHHDYGTWGQNLMSS
jgi:hypothetical protein